MLSQTHRLIERYLNSLVDGSISDTELLALLFHTFTPSKEYADPDLPISDTNHTVNDAIRDFVRSIAPRIDPCVLPVLTMRMIALSPDTNPNCFMRGSTLEKVFLGYLLYKQPDQLDEIVKLDRMQREFPSNLDIENLKRVILDPIIEFFKEHRGSRMGQPSLAGQGS